MPKPRLSFIVPYYRKEKSITKCIKSLFSQSIKDFEVIIVMDGEDLEAEKLILKAIGKHENYIIVRKENGGAPSARNYGLKFATGDYVSFWDADCYIESGAADVWLTVFRKYPDVDFVYSGYKFYPEGLGAIESESFDPWLLKVNNYISTMFPIKREKCPQWDESLKSLQDWDFWLTAVKNGCKGYYLRGYAFKTDYPDKDSISGKGCSPANWLDRLEAVKIKHGIPIKEVCVCSISDKESGIALAKILDADYRDMLTYFPNRYKTIIQIGFNPRKADVCAMNFKNNSQKSRNILFWRSIDVHQLRSEASRDSTDALSIILNSCVDIQLCEDFQTKKKLESMGFKAEVLSLPIDFTKGEVPPMPSEFKVLMDVSPEYSQLFDVIKRSMPDVKTKEFSGMINSDEFSVMVRFLPDRSLDMNAKKMLLNGRYLISNIQQPHCGYVSDERVSIEKAKKEIIRQIRKLQETKEQNVDAVEYYREESSVDSFKKEFNQLAELGVS